MPDTLASPQPDVPLYFRVSYKGIVEMPTVFSESTMVCQGYPSLSWGVTPLLYTTEALSFLATVVI